MKKILVLSLIILIIIISSTITYTIFMPQKIAVLTYHDFSKKRTNDEMTKNIDDFEKEMKFLKKHNYKTIKLDELECFMEKKCTLPRKSVLITMDDGWKSQFELALPILKKYNFNATIFHIGKYSNQKSDNYIDKEDIKIIRKKYKNIELAVHSYDNHSMEGYSKSKKEIKEDLEKIDNSIYKKYYAYPYGKYSKNYIKALKESEYKLAFTFGPQKEHRKLTNEDNTYLIPRLNLSKTYPYYKFVLRMILPF